MTKPGMTKAMMARMKHAEEMTKNLAKQRNEAVFQKPPRRPPPAGGRAPRARVASPPPCREARPEGWRPRGALQEAAACSPVAQRMQRRKDERIAAMRARKNACDGPAVVPGPCPRSPGRRQASQPQANSSLRRSRTEEQSGITEKTCELAQSMNAEIVQAEPVGEGPVQNIVIPPGAVSECRTTIVALPDTSGIENQSIQLINDTLDEQDAIEAAAVNSRLSELQNARRDFVLAVANVGNNVINVSGGGQSGCAADRGLYHLPEAEHDMFRVEYGRDHPTVNAAREFARRTRTALQEREAEMRMEREFAKAARCEGGLRLDVPMEQEFMEGDISFEEDESGVVIPCASRIKASMPPIPKRNIAAVPNAVGPEELERFFNLEAYPPPCDPSPPCGPPPGRENLNPDLWELDDPWYRERTPPEMPDLIDFDGC